MNEQDARRAMARAGRWLASRGLAPGTSGNISIAVEGGWLVTPTGRRLGDLSPGRLARTDARWELLRGDPPTKELPLHAAVYEARPGVTAVVHLHSSHAVAVSCLSGLDEEDALPPITPYQVMRLGRTALVPYAPPGSRQLGEAVRARAEAHSSLLLENHGPVVAGPSLEEVVAAAEELEESARLNLLLAGREHRRLSPERVQELRARFSPPELPR